jgi:hypothetical protein
MTGIDTLQAERYWNKNDKTEIDYLKAIGFIDFCQDEKGRIFISLLGDEEGNFDVRLTKKSALWLSDELIKFANKIKE